DGETDFFLGDEVSECDCFFAVVDFFRLCGVGVGVGEEKIFLIFSPTDSSAANGGEIVADRTRTDARNVESLRMVGRDPSTPLRVVRDDIQASISFRTALLIRIPASRFSSGNFSF